MIKLTPSNLAYWFESGCPAAWKFDQEWESLESKEWAERGTLVHSMMDGLVLRKDVEDRMALSFYDKLRDYWHDSGWKMLHDLDGKPLNELKQKFKIAPGVLLSRRLDRIALVDDGRAAIIDWKTTPGYGWKSVVDSGLNLVYPQANGFQSIGYLLPPPKDEHEKFRLPKHFKWPRRMYYVVAPLRGAIQVIRYDWSEEAHQNFIHATEVAIPSIKRGHFPKIPGKHCHDCRFKALCWQTPGWEDGYRQRTAARHHPDHGDGTAPSA